MRGNGASFGIVTEFVLELRDMPNNGIIRSAPILRSRRNRGGLGGGGGGLRRVVCRFRDSGGGGGLGVGRKIATGRVGREGR